MKPFGSHVHMHHGSLSLGRECMTCNRARDNGVLRCVDSLTRATLDPHHFTPCDYEGPFSLPLMIGERHAILVALSKPTYNVMREVRMAHPPFPPCVQACARTSIVRVDAPPFRVSLGRSRESYMQSLVTIFYVLQAAQ